MPEPTSARDLDFGDIPDPIGGARVGDSVDPARARVRDAGDASAPPEKSRTRAQQARFTLFAEIAIAAWLILAVLRLGVRGDMAWPLLLRVVALCLVGLIAQRVAAAPRQSLGPRLRAVQAVVLGVPAAFMLIAWLSGAGSIDDGLTLRNIGACFATTLAVAIVPLGLAGLLHRHAFAVLPAWRGASLGALGGLMGSIVIGVHCPVDAAPHVLLAHGMPIAVGALGGAALGALAGRL